MESTIQSAASTLPSPESALAQCRSCSNTAYQAVTIVAILLVLISVWVF